MSALTAVYFIPMIKKKRCCLSCKDLPCDWELPKRHEEKFH